MKKLIALLLTVIMAASLAGCGGEKEKKVETEELTGVISGYTATANVPIEKGYKFTDLQEEKDESAPQFAQLSLVGDKAKIYFEFSSYVYNTSITFEKDHPDMDADNPNFADFIKILYPDEPVLDLNGRKAIKLPIEEGPTDNLELLGYKYFIDGGEDFDWGYMTVEVYPTDEAADVNAFMEDPEVKVILESIKYAETK